MYHREQDNQSLMLHREAVRLMLDDDALRIRAIAILNRWDKTCDHHSKPLRDAWLNILQQRNWALALAQSERGNQLRQSSPVACVLPTKLRLDESPPLGI